MFEGRHLLVASKHDKEKVIAPIFEQELNVKIVPNTIFDTDILGTFSGEINRDEDVLTTLRKKCVMALQLHKMDLGIASEGSFGAHPSCFFLPGDEEFLILIDLKNNLEIVAKELSTETNFNGKYIDSVEELLDFALQIKFPSHGLILKEQETNFTIVHKGIRNNVELIAMFNKIKNSFGKVYVETDMRANYNPTRMRIIEKAAYKLVEKIKNKCPKCETPGFDTTTFNRGLPCGQCNSPTRSLLSVAYTCKKCNYTLDKMYPNDKRSEDPMYCDYCNP